MKKLTFFLFFALTYFCSQAQVGMGAVIQGNKFAVNYGGILTIDEVVTATIGMANDVGGNAHTHQSWELRITPQLSNGILLGGSIAWQENNEIWKKRGQERFAIGPVAGWVFHPGKGVRLELLGQLLAANNEKWQRPQNPADTHQYTNSWGVEYGGRLNISVKLPEIPLEWAFQMEANNSYYNVGMSLIVIIGTNEAF